MVGWHPHSPFHKLPHGPTSAGFHNLSDIHLFWREFIAVSTAIHLYAPKSCRNFTCVLLVMFATSCLSKSVYIFLIFKFILALALVVSLSNCSVTEYSLVENIYACWNTERCWRCMYINLFPHWYTPHQGPHSSIFLNYTKCFMSFKLLQYSTTVLNLVAHSTEIETRDLVKKTVACTWDISMQWPQWRPQAKMHWLYKVAGVSSMLLVFFLISTHLGYWSSCARDNYPVSKRQVWNMLQTSCNSNTNCVYLVLTD